jgi:hypothetical protein
MRMRVPRIAEVDRLAQHSLDRLRERKVHLRDERRKHVRRIGRPLFAAPPAKRRERHAIERIRHR